MPISSSIANTDFGWTVQLYTKDGNGNYQQSQDYYRSGAQTVTSTAEYGWNFGNNQEYQYNDTFRFAHTANDQENDLTKYSIFITQNAGSGTPAGMMLQVGNASLMGVQKTIDKETGYVFDLSNTGLNEVNGELKTSSVKSYLSSGTQKGVRTFTVQPFWSNDSNMGQESIVMSFGPQFYNSGIDNKIYTNDANSLKSITSLEGNGYDYFNVDGEIYQVKVGAIADYLLNQETLEDLNIVVNGRNNNSWVDGNEVLLSQNIIYRPAENASANNDDWKMFTLGFDHKIAVTGQEQNGSDYMHEGARISGTNIGQEKNSNDFQKFFGGLLDIYSTNQSETYSAEISGITFNDTPSRGMGTVTANGYYPAVLQEAWHDPNEKADYWSRLYKAIKSASAPDNNNIFDPKNGTINTSAKIWDNQILSWNTASDGIESRSPNLLASKNFYKVNDDALKLLSRKQIFDENTIHVGPDGAAISFGYGFNNGPVMDTNVNGAYIHRIVQPSSTPKSKYAGIIADWVYWNKNLIDPDDSTNAGIITPELSNIYIPSMKYGKNDANSMSRSGTISAVVHTDRKFFETAYAGKLENWYQTGQTYKAGGYNIGWENYLPAADFYFTYAKFNNDDDFDMSEGLNQFTQRKDFNQIKKVTLVMNKDNQNQKTSEGNFSQYVELSPVTITSSFKRSDNWVDSSSGTNRFIGDDNEFNVILSNSIGPSNRFYEFPSSSQSNRIIRLDASNLSEAKTSLSIEPKIIAAAPSDIDLTLSGLYLKCGSGHDEVTGSQYNDFLLGADGNDVIVAGFGDDIIKAGVGDDVLYGGRGNDYLDGGTGDDVINSGIGHDTLEGGTGADEFYINAGINLIKDFDASQGDTIQLHSSLNNIEWWQDGSDVLVISDEGITTILNSLASDFIALG